MITKRVTLIRDESPVRTRRVAEKKKLQVSAVGGPA